MFKLLPRPQPLARTGMQRIGFFQRQVTTRRLFVTNSESGPEDRNGNKGSSTKTPVLDRISDNDKRIAHLAHDFKSSETATNKTIGDLTTRMEAGFSDVKAKFDEVKSDTKTQFDEVKSDTKAQFVQFRSDTKAQFDEAKSDTKTQFAQFKAQLDEAKSDTKAQFDEVKSNTKAQFDEAKSDTEARFARFEARLDEVKSNTKAQFDEAKSDTKTQFAQFKTQLDEAKSDTKAQFDEVKSDTKAQLTDLKEGFRELRAQVIDQVAKVSKSDGEMDIILKVILLCLGVVGSCVAGWISSSEYYKNKSMETHGPPIATSIHSVPVMESNDSFTVREGK